MAEEVKQKRHRRTKKEMEAARRIDAASTRTKRADKIKDGNSSAPVTVESTKKVEELFVMFYCFQPTQVVTMAKWRDDGSVLCPHCNQVWLFDGEHFFDVKGQLHFWVDEKGNPGGHFLRYDLTQRGWRSPKTRLNKNWRPFDFEHEFDNAVQILGPEIAVGASAFTSATTERNIPVVVRHRVQNGKSRKSATSLLRPVATQRRGQTGKSGKSADCVLRPKDNKTRKATEGSATGKRRGRPPKMVG